MSERARETDDGTYPNVEEEQAKNAAREISPTAGVACLCGVPLVDQNDRRRCPVHKSGEPPLSSLQTQFHTGDWTPSALAAMQGKGSIEALCERSHAIAKEKGWCDKPRPFYSLSNLMQSELAEALEDFRAHRALDEIYYEESKVAAGPNVPRSQRCEIGYHQPTATGYCSCWVVDKKCCGIPIELADGIIRIAQFCGTEKIDLQKEVKTILNERLIRHELEWGDDFEFMLASANLFISLAFVSSNRPSRGLPGLSMSVGYEICEDSIGFYLASAWIVIFDFCSAHKIDIWAAINEKEAYNRSRSFRHGNKKV
jgi:NTP pyrophosphatase (non-canonical NTP hydrolase)